MVDRSLRDAPTSATRRDDGAPLDDLNSMMKEALGELKALRSKVDGLEERNARLEALLRESFDSGAEHRSTMESRFDDVEHRLKRQLNGLEERNAPLEALLRESVKADTEHRERVESRFDDVENRLKRQDIMIENQNWEYDVAHPPQEYWDSIAHELHAGRAAEKLLTDITTCTTTMMRGKAGNLVIGPDYHEDVAFPYHQVFQPHWMAFIDAIEKYQYALKCEKEHYSYLCFYEVQLTRWILDHLPRGLRHTHFTNLRFNRNDFGRDGIEFLMSHMRQNTILQDLCLENNTIEPGYFEEFSAILEKHPSLERLTVQNVTGDLHGFQLLRSIATAFASKLKFLSLCNNGISTGGSTFLSEFLATNPMLNDLFLEDNSFGDCDATMIAAALKHNSNLRRLDLLGNPITHVGVGAFQKAEFNPSSLKSVADSNHTCYITISSFQSVNLHTIEPSRVRSCKIYGLLSSRNEHCLNVTHFGNAPVGILPELLISMCKHSEHDLRDNENRCYDRYLTFDYVKPLSLVYEVMRRWDKVLCIYGALGNASSIE